MHTPGPWTTHKMPGHTAVAANTLIARVFSTAFGDLENERDNATLMAAALDLLDAAKAKLADCRENGDCSDPALMPDEYCSDECVALAEAVAKAEPHPPTAPEKKKA